MPQSSLCLLKMEFAKDTLSGKFSLYMRYTSPSSEAPKGNFFPTALDLTQLKEMISEFDEMKSYSKCLTNQVFQAQGAKIFFAEAMTNALTIKSSLRIQIVIGPYAEELNAVIWEVLCDPEKKTLMSINDNIWLSRYLSSNDNRPANIRPYRNLRILTAVSNPKDLKDWQLAPIDVKREIKNIKNAVPFSVDELPNLNSRTTLSNLMGEIQGRGVSQIADVVYLVCHGYFSEKNIPILLLEDENGSAKPEKGDEFVSQFENLTTLPRLIVLISCDSATQPGETKNSDEDSNTFMPLGPMLSKIGVPAVLAMQGKVTQAMIEEFSPIFFSELHRDGQIDRALTVARRKVQKHRRRDYWMPVLFLRSESGKLWTNDPNSSEKQSVRVEQNLLHYLANRTDQDDHIQSELLGKLDPQNPKPIVSIVHGNSLQCHEAFIERVKRKTLPDLGIDAEKIIHVKVQPQGKINTPNDFLMKFLQDMAKKTLYQNKVSPKNTQAMQDIQSYFSKCEGPILVSTFINTEDWINLGRGIISEYLKFWRNWPRLDTGQYVFAFLSLEYLNYPSSLPFQLIQSTRHKIYNREIKTYITRMSLNRKDDQIICSVLPELTNVTLNDARHWVYDSAAEYLNDTQDAVNAIGNIYKNQGQSSLSMDVLAKSLKEILISHSSRKEETEK